MGNTCVGPSISKNGFFQSVSAVMWPNRSPEGSVSHRKTGNEVASKEPESALPVQSRPPEQMTMPKSETRQETKSKKPKKPKPPHVKRVSSAGLRTESVLQTKTGNFKEYYSLGKKLGQGQFGMTFLCVEKSTGKEYACKSIAKRKLLTDEDVEDVRREIQIMHHLAGHPNVISIKGAYEDAMAVHVVMELCAGGELFDRIIQRGHYTERKAAALTRTIVGVVESCHSLGVMHRDLKPENFLFVNQQEDSLLKTIDFGLSMFFKPGETFTDVVGSPYYVAPEVLQKHYGPEADVWSAGVILYILLSGVPPFWAESEQGIFDQVLHGDLDFESDPWPNISESAKDLVRRMLIRDPKKRLTAHAVLCHPWIQVDGIAPNKPLDFAVLSRLKQFSAMNKLKKMVLRVIAENLSEEEIAGLKEMFKMIDTDNSGQITFEELKAGLKRVGANLKESEIYDLMQAADVDNSGTIDYGEFVAATLHLNKIEREDHLFAAFSYFDKDGSGYITPDELQQACEEFGIEDVRLEEMIHEVDQDNDGRIDYNDINMAAGEHKSENYLSLNPFGQVPAFEDGDLKLFESRAITHYIAHEYSDKGTQLLIPGSNKDMAVLELWKEVEAHQFDSPSSKIAWEAFYKPFFGMVTDSAAVEENEGKLAKVLDVYEARLTQSKYLASDCFTLADLHHIPNIQCLLATPAKKLIDSRPHVCAWVKEITARPAWSKVLAMQKQ